MSETEPKCNCIHVDTLQAECEGLKKENARLQNHFTAHSGALEKERGLADSATGAKNIWKLRAEKAEIELTKARRDVSQHQIIAQKYEDRYFEQLQRAEKAEAENTNLHDLLAQHSRHWEAIGIVCGGIDGDINDPFGNAESVKRALVELRSENVALKEENRLYMMSEDKSSQQVRAQTAGEIIEIAERHWNIELPFPSIKESKAYGEACRLIIEEIRTKFGVEVQG